MYVFSFNENINLSPIVHILFSTKLFLQNQLFSQIASNAVLQMKCCWCSRSVYHYHKRGRGWRIIPWHRRSFQSSNWLPRQTRWNQWCVLCSYRTRSVVL